MAPSEANAPVAPTTRMLVRGVTRHCPRCGSGSLYSSWFRLVDRCPRCNYLFDREEGFFLGAYVINFGTTIAGLALVMGALIAVLATNGSSRELAVVAVMAAIEALVVPLVFYPFSKTIWCAIDLAMHRSERWAAVGGGDPDAGGGTKRGGTPGSNGNAAG